MPTRVVTATLVTIAFSGAVAAFLYHQEELRAVAALNGARLVHVVLFAAFAWAAYFLGRWVTRGVLRVAAPPWEAELAFGLWILGVGVFVLAACHVLYPWFVRAFTLGIVGFSAPTAWRLARGAGEYGRLKWRALTPATALVGLAVLPFAAAVLLPAGEPPVHYDVLVYHLYLPKAFLHNHGFFFEPRFAYSSMPLGVEMIFTWAYGWDGPGSAAAVAPLLNCLLVVACWRLARRYLDNFWATTAAVVLFFTPTFAQLVNIALVDFALAAFVTTALLVYLRGFAARGDAIWAGLLLGAALSVKYTGVYALGAFLPLLLIDIARRRLTWSRGFWFLAAAAAAAAPWLIKSYIERGNPFFPAFFDAFGGRGMTADAAAGLVRALRGVGMGRSLSDYAFLLYRVSVVGGFGYERFAGSLWPFSFVALPLAFVIFRRWRLILFTCFYFAAWAFIGTQELRFFGAGFATMAVIIVGVLAAGADAFVGRARTAARALTASVVLIMGYGINADVVITDQRLFAGYITMDNGAFQTTWSDRYRVATFINRNLPADATILMIFDGCRFYLERRAIADAFNEASQTFYDVGKMKTPEEVARYVRGLGADYIMTNRMGAGYFGRFYPAATLRLWDAYVNTYAVTIYRDEYNEVRAVLPSGKGEDR